MDDPKKTPPESTEPPKKGKGAKEQKVKYGFPRKYRGGELLTLDEVRKIRAERRKLRRELRKVGEKDRKEFELTASSLGLYFDENKAVATFKWFMATKGLWALLAAGLLLLLAMWGFSAVSELQGHFTVNLSRDLFKQGFSLSEDASFDIRTSHLFSTPAVSVPCISIVDIAEDVDEVDGEHNGNYYAYTFYIRNEGDRAAGYEWELRFDTVTEVADAAWVMIFEDGEMTLYARANADGSAAAIPSVDDDSRAYLRAPLYEKAKDKSQYEVVRESGDLTYWRVIPKPFVGEEVAASGEMTDVEPGEVHKYTIVIWLEGDDPDCTDELIGGHLGFELYISLIEDSGAQ